MCTESTMANNSTKTVSANKFTTSYSIKKVLKAIFKKNKVIKAANSCESLESVESLESLDNLRNAQVEDYATEIEDNAANELLMAKCNNFDYDVEYDDEEEHFLIPVNCVQTPSGTFFWTTASCNADADKDLIQPLYCYSENQIAELQDRWAQA